MKPSPLGVLKHKARVGWDRLRGLDFETALLTAEAAGLDSKMAGHSSPSGGGYLRNALLACGAGPGETIVDVGCGKGSALRTMCEFPFAEVCGIELAPSLADIARRNFRTLGETRVRIECQDASAYDGYESFDFVYLYNPFPAPVMQQFLQQLIHAVVRRESEVLLIYNNPVCDNCVLDTGRFRVVAILPDKWGHGIRVYSTAMEEPSRVELRGGPHLVGPPVGERRHTAERGGSRC
jgi:SAM-dependent methyltransferase